MATLQSTSVSGSLIISGSTSPVTRIIGSGSTLLSVSGSLGELFAVTDELSGSLFSVNNDEGLPLLEVFSDGIVNIGTVGEEAIIVNGNTASITGSVFGTATTASYVDFTNIDNKPTLISGSAEGDNQGQIKLNGQNVNTNNLGTDDSPSFAGLTVDTNTLYVDATNNRVGIGTTNPAEKLDIIGAVKASNLSIGSGSDGSLGYFLSNVDNSNDFPIGGNPNTAGIKIENDNQTAGSYSSVFLRSYTGDAHLYASTTGVSNAVNFGIWLDNTTSGQATTRFFINGESGNVGIGTTSPANKLDVNGGIDADTLNTGQGDNELYAMNQNVQTTDSVTFAGLTVNGNGTVNGDLTITGKVTAEEFHTEFVSASIIYRSGSTQFGDTADDTHNFTGNVNIEGSGSTVFSVDGSSGRLFSITDDLSDSLFSANTIAGLPVLEVFSDNTVKIGTFNDEAIIVNGNTAEITGSLEGTSSYSDNSDLLDGQEGSYYLNFNNHTNKPTLISGSSQVDYNSIQNTPTIGNATITISAGTALTTGGDFTTNQTGNETITINHSPLFRSDSTDSQTLTFGGTFDAVSNVGTTTEGHVSGSTNKTFTLPSLPSDNVTGTGTSGQVAYFTGANTIDSESNLFWDATNNRLGIGTSSPSELLHLSGSSNNAIINLENNGNGNVSGINFTRERLSGPGIVGASIFVESDTTQNHASMYLQAQSNGPPAGTTSPLTDNNGVRVILGGGNGVGAFIVENGSSESLRIDSSGRVGINDTSPSYTLDVNGDIRVTDDLFVDDFARIDALRIGTTSTDPGDGNLYVEGNSTLVGTLTVGGNSVLTTADEGSGNGIDADTVDSLEASQFLRSDVEDQATVINIGGEIIAGSAAKLQVYGFMRTGPIMIAEGTTADTTFDDTNQIWLKNSGGNLYAGTSSTTFEKRVLTTADEGSGNGLDADTVDGLEASQFLRSDQSGTLTGDLTVTGKITAEEFHTEFVSASIIYQSGSTKFGDTQDDNHNFTGSVNITGSLSVNGSSVLTEVDYDVFVCHLKTNINSSLVEGSSNEFTVNFNLEEHNDTSKFSHSSGVITVLESGWYNVYANMVYDNSVGSARDTINAYVKLNGTRIDSTQTFDYDRGSDYGRFSNNKVETTLYLNANDTISIGNYAYNEDGSVTIESDMCEFIVRSMAVETTTTNSDTVDGLHASQFVRSDTNDTMNGNLTLNGDLLVRDYIRIDHTNDERGIVFEDSDGADTGYITINDGQGNMNIMLGVNGDGNHVETGDGSSKLLFTAHGNNGEISLNAGQTGTAGNAVSFNIGLSLDSEDQKLRIGNPGNSVGLNAASGNIIADVNGDLITRYLRARDGNGLNIGDDSDTLGIFIKDGGDVGIGTTSPGAKLDVRGSVIFNEDGGNYDFRVESDTNPNMLFVDASTDRVGIGTASPANTLDVNGTLKTSGNALLGIASSLHQLYGTVAINTNTVPGTVTSPSKVFNVDGSGSDVYGMFTQDGNNAGWLSFYAGATSAYMFYRNTGNLIWGNSTQAGGNSFSEKMRLDSSGNLGIGASSPNAKLDVRGSAIFNEDGGNNDFRIESDTKTHMFFVDASADRIGINEATPSNMIHLTDGNLQIESTDSSDHYIYFLDNVFTGELWSMGIDIEGSSGNFVIANNEGLGSNVELTISGTGVDITGTLSKGAGSFKIPHPNPEKPDKTLWHSFVESPTAGDNIYRWQIEVKDKTHKIELPDYYKFLNENHQIWISPVKHFGQGWGEVNEDETFVEITTNQDGIYNVLLIGTRKDEVAKKAWKGTERDI